MARFCFIFWFIWQESIQTSCFETKFHAQCHIIQHHATSTFHDIDLSFLILKFFSPPRLSRLRRWVFFEDPNHGLRRPAVQWPRCGCHVCPRVPHSNPTRQKLLAALVLLHLLPWQNMANKTSTQCLWSYLSVALLCILIYTLSFGLKQEIS